VIGKAVSSFPELAWNQTDSLILLDCRVFEVTAANKHANWLRSHWQFRTKHRVEKPNSNRNASILKL
jgi:hypothetical protein